MTGAPFVNSSGKPIWNLYGTGHLTKPLAQTNDKFRDFGRAKENARQRLASGAVWQCMVVDYITAPPVNSSGKTIQKLYETLADSLTKPLAQPNDCERVPLSTLGRSDAASIKLSGGLVR